MFYKKATNSHLNKTFLIDIIIFFTKTFKIVFFTKIFLQCSYLAVLKYKNLIFLYI